MMLERSVRENARKSFSQNENNTVCLYNLQTQSQLVGEIC